MEHTSEIWKETSKNNSSNNQFGIYFFCDWSFHDITTSYLKWATLHFLTLAHKYIKRKLKQYVTY